MFCLPYYPDSTFDYSQVDQIIIGAEAELTLEDIRTIVEKYQKQTINIYIPYVSTLNQNELKIYKALSDTYKNIKLVFSYKKSELLKQIKNAEIPFYFSNYISQLDELQGVMNYQPTDIYICEELGFYLKELSETIHNRNIRIRVFPNICQSSYSGTPGIKTFFIRPEDISVYEKYVDVFELITDKARQSTLYKVYKQGYWQGRITEIIPSFKNLPEQANSAFFYSSLDGIAEIRTSCKKRCMYSPNSCKICDRFINLAITIDNNSNKEK